MLTVPPAQRGRGAGTALYRGHLGLGPRARARSASRRSSADNDPDSLAFAERRGFVEERREKGVALDLTTIEPPPVEPPPGVEIVTWADRPELARGPVRGLVEASPDVPGYEDEEHRVVRGLARARHARPGRPARGDLRRGRGRRGRRLREALPLDHVSRRRAYHDLTAVKRAWRGRGIARALKAAQIGWAKANGYELLRTQNDERNAPMRRLNDQLGYRPAIGRIYLRGPLA